MDDLQLTTRATGVRLRVRVKPRASRSAIVGTAEGILAVALAAPPVDGEANAELVRFLATVTGLRKSDITLVSGTTSRTKLVDIAGLTEAELRGLLRPSLLGGSRK